MKTKLFKQGVFICLLLIFAVGKTFAQAQVVSGKVIFITPDCNGCDNKDHDTKIRVSVIGIYGYEVASAYYTEDREFQDNGSRNDVPLTIRPENPIYANAVNPVQKIIVTIEPNGNDDWVFKPLVVFTLSDGSTITTDFNQQVGVSASSPQVTVWKRN